MRIALLLSLMAVATTAQPAEPLQLEVGGHQVQAEYADTFLQRQRGLMGRTELAADSGMLFRFDEVRRHCLWMKDTPLPLSAAFLDEDGAIVDVIDLEPLSTDVRCSEKPARYALEMHQGWFGAQGIRVGDRVTGLPEAWPPADG